MTKPMTFEEYCQVNAKLNIPREAQFAIYQDYVAAYERQNPVPTAPASVLTDLGTVTFYADANFGVTSKLRGA